LRWPNGWIGSKAVNKNHRFTRAVKASTQFLGATFVKRVGPEMTA
jgi:hypothetical protein